jgi:hypothetical protein
MIAPAATRFHFQIAGIAAAGAFLAGSGMDIAGIGATNAAFLQIR